MTIRFIGPLLCGGLSLFAALAPPPVSAAPTVVNCSPAKMKAVVSEFTSSTHLQTFQNVSEAAVAFTQGGTGPSCVVVRFSAEAAASLAPTEVVVRAFLDGVTATALPAEVHYGVAEGTGMARSYEFIFPSVAAGNHVVRMQFRSTDGGTVLIGRHSTFVLYKP